MTKLIGICLAALMVSPALGGDWKLVWSDEFDKPGRPDPQTWNYETGFVRNHEAQFYTKARPENARVEDGHLIIEARKERWKNPDFDPTAGPGNRGSRDRRGPEFADYTSASLTTRGKAAWTHGRIEVRAKLPSARGTWPAIWTLGTNGREVGWPRCGEIDIMEFVGFEPGVIHANIHTAKYNHVKGNGKGDKIAIADASEAFHVYATEWDADKVDFFVDDKKYFTYLNEKTGTDAWPYDKDQYLILNLAIGGTWGGQKGIDDSAFPQRFIIDYVRVYQAAQPTSRPGRVDSHSSSPLPIGSAAPPFDLPGIDGRQHRLSDFDKAPILVVVFTCDHCPTAQAYESRIKKLAEDYKGRSVQMVAISPNDPEAVRLDELGYTDLGDTLNDMRIRARQAGFNFPYLYDGETQKVSRAYGPKATPHVFIFDAERKLRYCGRIDDSEDAGKIRQRDARNAIDALLAGKPVPVETTKTFGCSIKWSDKRASVAQFMEQLAREPVELETVNAEALRQVRTNPGGKLRLINVWATWCGPCVVELPRLVETNRMYRNRNFEFVTISMDSPSRKAEALRVLKQNQAANRNVVLDQDKPYEVIEIVDPEWSGALPYTLLVEPGGNVVYSKEGALDPLELRRAIVDKLGRSLH